MDRRTAGDSSEDGSESYHESFFMCSYPRSLTMLYGGKSSAVMVRQVAAQL